MSWLLFMDESGHDHKNMPMEVRGGIAIHAGRVWDFVQAFHQAELDVFGVRLSEYSSEIKGCKLLGNRKCKWANQEHELDAASRKKGVKRFLTKRLQKTPQSLRDFTAYGQASKLMAKTIFHLLTDHDAHLFASMIPRGIKPPKGYEYSYFLRKDHIFMQERFFYFLESKEESGIFVMDQTEK